ncbi:caspase family protein [Meiothermus cerbereus]|uniref:caspase family protein n=1 Tax=Meiothermus cerbereus TaxID=65552 RepID=UPI00048343A8|nr:caspase family protein [Meiothermus cerbereus]
MPHNSSLFVTWLVGLGMLALGVAQPMPKPETYALVIGINNYRPYPDTPSLPPLSYAESDARKMAQALRDPNKGQLSKVRVLLDTEASKTAIEAELRGLARRMGISDTLIVYYSGHGMPSRLGQAALMPSDAKINDEETWLPLDWLQELVRKASQGKGRLILIVDACFSGQSLAGSRSFAMPGRKSFPKPQKPDLNGANVLLASSADTQPSWEDAEVGGGIFTAYLLEAISGKADANGDGYVTIGEAYRYAAVQVEAFSQRKGTPQTPQLYGPDDYTLALNPLAVAKSRLAGLKLAGHISGEQFDALVERVEGRVQPEDLLLYLSGNLTSGQFVSLVQAGAIPGVPPLGPVDARLQKIGKLRREGKIRLEQLWVLFRMIQTGKAAPDLSEYLAGRLPEVRFLQRLRAGAIQGVPR